MHIIHIVKRTRTIAMHNHGVMNYQISRQYIIIKHKTSQMWCEKWCKMIEINNAFPKQIQTNGFYALSNNGFAKLRTHYIVNWCCLLVIFQVLMNCFQEIIIELWSNSRHIDECLCWNNGDTTFDGIGKQMMQSGVNVKILNILLVLSHSIFARLWLGHFTFGTDDNRWWWW